MDALRGAALFGILAANMRGFFAPASAYFNWHKYWTDPANVWTQAVIDILISGKFVTIFAFLFGAGFAIQLARCRERGVDFGFYNRRLAALLAFGLAHSFLLWWGDILAPYAVCGYVLLLFRNRSDRLVYRCAMGFYWWPLAVFAVMAIATLFGAKIPGPPDPTDGQFQEQIRIFQQGSYLEIFRQRARDWSQLNAGFLFFFPRVIGLFLFGLWVWRKGVLADIAGHSDLLRRVRRWGLAIGLPANIAMVGISLIWHPNPFVPSPLGAVELLLGSIGMPALSAFYAATVLLAPAGRWLRYFSYVGRMALTNYLLQTLVCTTLFYSYGFKLFGTIGPFLGLVPTFLVYGLQIPFSAWWLASRRYGPMELVWRKLTYGKGASGA